MKACILLKTGSGAHNEVAKAAGDIDGVKAAFPVLGRFDVIVRVETTDLAKVAQAVSDLNKIPLVLSSETLVELVG